MKKLLLTTALLGASAGMAMADVTISGSGRFGIENRSGTQNDFVAHGFTHFADDTVGIWNRKCDFGGRNPASDKGFDDLNELVRFLGPNDGHDPTVENSRKRICRHRAVACFSRPGVRVLPCSL